MDRRAAKREKVGGGAYVCMFLIWLLVGKCNANNIFFVVKKDHFKVSNLIGN